MRASFFAACLAGAMAPGAASAAAPYHALLGKLVPDKCTDNVCSFISIDQASPAGTSDKGALFRLDVKYWVDENGRRRNNSSETVYVFCSTAKPAYIYGDEGSWQAAILAPGNQEQISEANTTALVTYWAGCHATAVKDVYAQAPQLANQFGYDINAQSEDSDLKAPGDALAW